MPSYGATPGGVAIDTIVKACHLSDIYWKTYIYCLILYEAGRHKAEGRLLPAPACLPFCLTCDRCMHVT